MKLLERSGKIMGTVLAGLAFLVYLATLCPGAAPGLSARLIVEHSGMDPFPPMSHLLWSACVRVLALIPLGPLPVRLNVFSALCAAVAIGTFYHIVRRLPLGGPGAAGETDEAGRTVAAMVAALFLAFCIPFWLTATQAHPASFDLLLLFGLMGLAQRFRTRTNKERALCLFALLYGLAMTEYATLIMLAPFFAAGLLYATWQTGTLRVRAVLAALFCLLVGTAPYYLYAIFYKASAAAEWREFGRYFDVLWFIWREQYIAIVRSVPRVGWLLLFFITLLPWMVTVVAGWEKRPTYQSKVGGRVLHLALAALAVTMLFNIRLAPWPLFGLSPLLVMPYVLIACWSANVVAYWYRALSMSERRDERMRPWLLRIIGTVYLPLVMAALIVAACINGRSANGRAWRPVLQFADRVVQNLDGRTWLVSAGSINDSILLAAREAGVPVRILDPRLGAQPPYRRYVASVLENPRLEGMALLGLGPMLNAWLREMPDSPGHVAILGGSDLWLANGFRAIPDRVLFMGEAPDAEVDADELMAEHRAFWDSYALPLARTESPSVLQSGWREWMLMEMSKLANNLGVLLADLDQKEAAREAYDAARQLDERNLSAMLNLLALAREEDSPDADALRDEIEVLTKRSRIRLSIWDLARRFGYVRNARQYARHGWAWAVTGALPEPKPVLPPREPKPGDVRVGSMLVPEKVRKDREAELRAALDASQDNPEALIGMIRISIMDREFDAARSYLEQLRALDVPEVVVKMEEAALESAAGHRDASKRLLLEVVEQDPNMLKAWASLALIADQEEDEALFDRCVKAFDAAPATESISLRFTLADILARRQRFVEARKQLALVARSRPSDKTVLEQLVRVDMQEGNRALAEQHLPDLLSLDPSNALGNHVLGLLQMARGEFHLAEASLRASVATESSANVLNDLAWVLGEQGDYEEAVRFAREALDLDEKNGSAWDTLGMAQLKLGRLDEAERSILKALEIQSDHPEIMLHMAEVYERKGMIKEALKLADELLDKAAQMRPEAFEEVRQLVQRLRQKL